MKRVLPVIVLSQFLCTSLWFAGNAVLPDLAKQLNIASGTLANLISAVQLGFITGTFIFALLGIADRFIATQVFFVCAILAAVFNTGITITLNETGLLAFRFFTGFFLAGIYPVGIKIAADHYQKWLGQSLGLLVGALVLGTAFPHLLKSLNTHYPWQYVLFTTSLFSVLGGCIMWRFVPQGKYTAPYKKAAFNTILSGLKTRDFSPATLGYFGHMWELYTFWTFLPALILTFKIKNKLPEINISLWSFLIIASGAIACVLSGYLLQYFGTKRVAITALSLSCCCCLASPLFLSYANTAVLFIFLLFWAMVVIADSPLFSTLVAQNAPAEKKGTLLTITTCIGFLLTIISIQVFKILALIMHNDYIFLFLAIGPVLGLWAMFKKQAITIKLNQ
jgi:MFS family permease